MVSSATLKVSILEGDEVKGHMPLSTSVIVTLTEYDLKYLLKRTMKNCIKVSRRK